MPSYPKSARLLSSTDFAAVRKGGVRARVGRMLVSVLPAAGRRRLGIAITRRVGGAVERNRIRRVVREFFRLNRSRFPEGDCVVVPVAGAADLDNRQIRTQLLQALEKLARR